MVIDKFLSHGLNLNECDRHGNTLLHTAVKSEDHDAIRHLLKKGIDLSIKNLDSQTARQLAETERPSIVKFFPN